MIQCPECRQMIPDDSAFCDQCGKELKWCPECKRPKRGTECPVCGSDLIPGRKWLEGDAAAAAGASAGAGAPASDAASTGGGVKNAEKCDTPQGFDGGGASKTPENAAASALVGNNWRLELREGQFGRSGGIWPELSTCPYVSGRHGTISGGAGSWTITDIGSTNGTYIDGARLQTGVATPLKKGSKVRIATLDFTVE